MQRTIVEKKESLKLGLSSLSSTLGWGNYIESIAKTTLKKVDALIRSMNYLRPEIVLHYIYIYSIHSKNLHNSTN